MESMCIGGNIGVKVAAERLRVTFACEAPYLVYPVSQSCVSPSSGTDLRETHIRNSSVQGLMSLLT